MPQCQGVLRDGYPCRSPAFERMSPAGGALGPYCTRHFRAAFPSFAPGTGVPGEKRITQTDRQAEAYRLRHAEHLSLREIGARLGGVTAERARQLVCVAERKQRRAQWEAPTHCPNWVGEGVVQMLEAGRPLPAPVVGAATANGQAGRQADDTVTVGRREFWRVPGTMELEDVIPDIRCR